MRENDLYFANEEYGAKADATLQVVLVNGTARYIYTKNGYETIFATFNDLHNYLNGNSDYRKIATFEIDHTENENGDTPIVDFLRRKFKNLDVYNEVK